MAQLGGNNQYHTPAETVPEKNAVKKTLTFSPMRMGEGECFCQAAIIKTYRNNSWLNRDAFIGYQSLWHFGFPALHFK